MPPDDRATPHALNWSITRTRRDARRVRTASYAVEEARSVGFVWWGRLFSLCLVEADHGVVELLLAHGRLGYRVGTLGSIGTVDWSFDGVEVAGSDCATCRKNSSMYCSEVGSYCEG